jgi:ABC-type nitrate/sulfonate/bicarbonate transport system ATPase subunit
MTSSRPSNELPILEAVRINISYEGKPTLQDISFALYRGEILVLLGVSGSGKTTLFNILAGLLKPESGAVFLEGKEVTGICGQVAYMLQKDLLLKHMTVLENVCLPMVIRGVPKSQAVAAALPHFQKFGLEGYEHSYPYELSGGMAQRAAFLRTHLFSREVALLDEPFSALDAITKDQMHRWYLRMMKDNPLSVVLITHDIDEAVKLADRILIMSTDGRISEEVSIDPALRRSSEFYLKPAFLDYKRRLLVALGQEAF